MNVPAQPRPKTCDTTNMVIVHRVFRREFGRLPRLVRAVDAGNTARATRVAAHAQEMLSTLHHHHSGEDELLWPKLNARVELERPLVDRMEEQHLQVAALISRVETLLTTWTTAADTRVGAELSDVLEQLETSLNEHLDEEERQVLPIVEHHITEAEWDELANRGMAAMPKSRLLVQLGYMLEDTSPDERAQLLDAVPLPARIAYRLVGERKYRAETEELRADVA